MELDFNKEKQRVSKMSDTALVARLRDPSLQATDKMLIEAEISRRGLERRHVMAAAPEPVAEPGQKKSSPFGLLIFVVVAFSILSTILDDMGIDVFEWLRNFFFPGD
ncbi:MAG: hypothetical protein KJO35_01235 [Gammaproteobacteria bacterium]|nr:hypothetical protein [Gammaproteobacteria bacterium]